MPVRGTCNRCLGDPNSWDGFNNPVALSKSPYEDELEFCSFCGFCPTQKGIENLLEISRSHLKEIQAYASNVKALLAQGHDLAKLLVGPKKIVIEAPKVILCFYSPVLKAALRKNFPEAASGKMTMPEDCESSIRCLVGWMQTGSITYDEVQKSKWMENTGTALAQLWIVGNKYLSNGFCNAIMHLLFLHITDHYLHPEAATYVFENTLESSKLRKFVLDYLQAYGPFSHCHDEFRDEWLEFIAREETP